MAKNAKKKSVARQVFSYLDTHPYSRQAIVMGIANLSALSRRIKEEAALPAKAGAIKAALRRYNARDDIRDYSKDLASLFRSTRLQIKNKIAVLILRSEAVEKLPAVARRTHGDYSVLSATEFSVLMVTEELVDEIVRLIGKPLVKQIIRNQALILLSTPVGIETSPGWVAFFSDALAKEGINIREYYSVYTETVFVLSKKDAIRAYEILDNML